MSDERIVQALATLAQQDRELQASPDAGKQVIRRFRRYRALRRRKWIAAGALAAGVAASLLVFQREAAEVPLPATSAAALVSTAGPVTVPTLAPAARKLRETRARAVPRETVTEFFPWTDPAPPFDRGQLLRVELPASVMRSVGLPVPENHLSDVVQADVLVGEEGLPRAIRFVKFDMQ